MSVEAILMDWDYLKPAAIFSALAYYHDHKDEIDKLREENSYEYWLKHHAHKFAQTSPQ